MVDDINKSFWKNLNERISSPFYGAFIISWLFWNWKVWYVTFFIDSNLLLQEKGVLKINYIISIYASETIWSFILSFSHLIIFPFLSAWFFIYIFPKMTCKFYAKSLETENENKLTKIKKNEEFLIVTGKKLEAEKDIFKKEAELKEEKIKSEKSQGNVWNDEYEQFKESKYFQDFNEIKKCIYDSDGWGGDLPVDLKAYFDSNKITEGRGEGNGRIKLTEKGKYFMKKYTNEK